MEVKFFPANTVLQGGNVHVHVCVPFAMRVKINHTLSESHLLNVLPLIHLFSSPEINTDG